MQHPDMSDLSPDQIAAELDRERAELAGNIDHLRDRLSVDALFGDAVDFAKTNIAPFGRALDSAVRANPVAAVMAGVGLAWLAFGRRRSADGPVSAVSGTKFEALSRWEDEGGPPAPSEAEDDRWIAEADTLRSDALRALARIDAAARAQLRPVAEVARDRAEVLADLAKATRAAMLQGLEGLGSEARARILALREQAYATRNMAVRQGNRLIEDRPVVAGAIGMAVGAAVAAALPPTATEDRIFGEERDRLLQRAQEALRRERARAGQAAARVADTVAAEVKTGARQLVTEVI
jgi:ElaB/YqjD/DUF883 family membrane-anchored ribosome-binding protein